MKTSVLLLALTFTALGCSHPTVTETPIPIQANSQADKERLIQENTQLTASQKQEELAKLKAMGSGK